MATTSFGRWSSWHATCPTRRSHLYHHPLLPLHKAEQLGSQDRVEQRRLRRPSPRGTLPWLIRGGSQKYAHKTAYFVFSGTCLGQHPARPAQGMSTLACRHRCSATEWHEIQRLPVCLAQDKKYPAGHLRARPVTRQGTADTSEVSPKSDPLPKLLSVVRRPLAAGPGRSRTCLVLEAAASRAPVPVSRG